MMSLKGIHTRQVLLYKCFEWLSFTRQFTALSPWTWWFRSYFTM